jgi:hypothetical protein
MRTGVKVSIAASVLWVAISTGQANEQAFFEYYHHPEIDPYKCGQNTQKFLRFLQETGRLPEVGYVVNVEEPYGELNHFESRWGQREVDSAGQAYFRSNWCFHVFAVLSGQAYDFSWAGPRVLPVGPYLEAAYFPRAETGPVGMQGRLSRESETRKYANLKMELFRLPEFAQGTGAPIYRGRFLELFEVYSQAQTAPLQINPRSEARILFEHRIPRPDGSVTYSGVRAQGATGEFAVTSIDADQVCFGLGHRGALPHETQETLAARDYVVARLSSHFTHESGGVPAVGRPLQVTVSMRTKKHSGAVPLQLASRVTCADLTHWKEKL